MLVWIRSHKLSKLILNSTFKLVFSSQKGLKIWTLFQLKLTPQVYMHNLGHFSLRKKGSLKLYSVI